MSNRCMGRNEQAVIQAILAGEKDAYGELVKRHSHSLFRVAFRITGNEADADDVVQDALLRGYRKLATFDGRSSFGTWIYRIAVRCALEKLRESESRSRWTVGESLDPEDFELQAIDGAAGPERLLLSGEVTALRERAMSRLSASERTAFLLRHVEERTTEEIAEALEIAPNAAKQTVFRAVQKLRSQMAPLRVPA